MTRLTWSDIFTDSPELDFERLFGLWPNTVVGPLRPLGASAFGDLFFERPSGHIERLDVLEGGVHMVAATFDAFSTLMNSPEWPEACLLAEGVALLKERGLGRADGQFFAFVPHPAFSGEIDWSRVIPMDAAAWHRICAELLDTRAQ